MFSGSMLKAKTVPKGQHVGANPELDTTTPTPSPLDSAKSFLRGIIASRDERFNVEEGEKLIYLMEEKVARGASPSSMDVVF